MTTRRTFLKSSALGVGSLAWAASFAPSLAQAVQGGVRGVVPSVLGGHVRRFVFMRKTNGIRPHEVALPTFNESQATLDKNKKTLEVDLESHELPEWLETLTPYKKNLSILQGLSCMMSENGHWSYSSVLGAFK